MLDDLQNSRVKHRDLGFKKESAVLDQVVEQHLSARLYQGMQKGKEYQKRVQERLQ